MNNKEKTYHVMTYGCQMNVHESEKIEGMLENLGYTQIDSLETADIIAVNTCCIRESAESKIISNIGYLKKYNRGDGEPIIIVCGCLTQQTALAKKLFSRFRHVRIIVGTYNIHKLSAYIKQTLDTGERILDVEEKPEGIPENFEITRGSSTSAYVNVMYGCNNFCAYCIVPYVRGRERSRSMDTVLTEIKHLSDNDYKEIMLLGQNVNSFGKGLNPEVSFSDLLHSIEEIKEIKRVRFMTSHPKDLSDDLIDVFKTRKSVCNHIHLPVQAGSSRVLKMMNRRYDKAHYLSLIDKLREASPDIAITTDIIVGFPGETEADFLETLDLVKRVQYDSAYTFKYSKRSGTKAATMPDHISDEVKTDRIMRLLEIQNKITYDKNKSLVGKTFNVLVEGRHDKNGQMFGRSDDFRLINFESKEDLTGQFANVTIIKAMKNSLLGQLD